MAILQQTKGTPLQEWANAHEPDQELSYRHGYWRQIVFVRDQLTKLVVTRGNLDQFREVRDNHLTVISTHRSKSVELPVIRMELPSGIVATMRNNFYNWVVSIESPRDISVNFRDLFDSTARAQAVYCEGFPESLVFGPYAENKQNFTVSLGHGDYGLFTFFWLLTRYQYADI